MIPAMPVEWEKTVDAIDDWICVIGLDATIKLSNRSVEKYFGLPPEAATGIKACWLAHGSDTPQPDCPLPKMLLSRRRESGEIRFKDGRWMFVTVDPLFSNGNMTGAIHIARNITGRKLAQVERDRLINDLTKALARVQTLRGMLPICSICKKVRDDAGAWNQIEGYIHERTGVDFSHGLCPECAREHYPEVFGRK